MARNKEISVGVKIDGNAKGFKDAAEQAKKASESMRKGMDSANKKTEGGFAKVTSAVKVLGVAIGAAFIVKKVTDFALEIGKLGGQVSGITTAFEKLNRVGLLDNLREATRGTVSDLELMKSAIRAENFKIPLDQLATYFKFATNRAIETGESVDYLVESIINGIGRKSTLVIDNLGISASELQKEITKTGDFAVAVGNIINGELIKTGDIMDTTAIKVNNISTAWTNFRNNLAKKISGTWWFTDVVGGLQIVADKLAESNAYRDDPYGLSNMGLPQLTSEYNKTSQNISALQASMIGYNQRSEGLSKSEMKDRAEQAKETQKALDEQTTYLAAIEKALKSNISNIPIKPDFVTPGISAVDHKRGILPEDTNITGPGFVAGMSLTKEQIGKYDTALRNLQRTKTELDKRVDDLARVAKEVKTPQDLATAEALRANLNKDIEAFNTARRIIDIDTIRKHNANVRDAEIKAQLELEEEKRRVQLIEDAKMMDIMIAEDKAAIKLREEAAEKELSDIKSTGDQLALEKASGYDKMRLALEQSLEKELELVGDNLEARNNLYAAYALMRAEIDKKEQEDMAEGWSSLANQFENAFSSMFTAISANSNDAFQDMVKAFGRALQQMAAQFAAKAAMFLLLSIISGGTGAAAGIAKTLMGTGGLKGFMGLASGGIVSGPTLAQIGEYPGASSNPEVVAPLSKLKGMLGGQNVNVNVTGKVSGRDLELVLARHLSHKEIIT